MPLSERIARDRSIEADAGKLTLSGGRAPNAWSDRTSAMGKSIMPVLDPRFRLEDGVSIDRLAPKISEHRAYLPSRLGL
jgi:hypothetical protein